MKKALFLGLSSLLLFYSCGNNGSTESGNTRQTQPQKTTRTSEGSVIDISDFINNRQEYIGKIVSVKGDLRRAMGDYSGKKVWFNARIGGDSQYDNLVVDLEGPYGPQGPGNNEVQKQALKALEKELNDGDSEEITATGEIYCNGYRMWVRKLRVEGIDYSLY